MKFWSAPRTHVTYNQSRWRRKNDSRWARQRHKRHVGIRPGAQPWMYGAPSLLPPVQGLQSMRLHTLNAKKEHRFSSTGSMTFFEGYPHSRMCNREFARDVAKICDRIIYRESDREERKRGGSDWRNEGRDETLRKVATEIWRDGCIQQPRAKRQARWPSPNSGRGASSTRKKKQTHFIIKSDSRRSQALITFCHALHSHSR